VKRQHWAIPLAAAFDAGAVFERSERERKRSVSIGRHPLAVVFDAGAVFERSERERK
jgi:hypothetical protein